MAGKWIWLNPEKYPTLQECPYNLNRDSDRKGTYCMVEFQKTFDFASGVRSLNVEVSGDTRFKLFLNGTLVGEGPCAAGGDFLYPEGTLDWYYKNTYTFDADVFEGASSFTLSALVQLTPQVLTEFSYGNGGFFVNGSAELADGKTVRVDTDTSWLCRLDRRYAAPLTFDGTLSPDEWLPAFETGDARQLTPSPVKNLVYESVLPADHAQNSVTLSAGETALVDFDRIYAGYIDIEANAACSFEISCLETPEKGRRTETVTFGGAERYESMRMHSIGMYEIKILAADVPVTIKPSLRFVHYPAPYKGEFVTSDPELNAIYDLCRWTLGICRQSIHLDSPTHQELLACTGDYYIESLMTLFTFGDMSLARGDVIRTANWLVQNDGRMFHTTYSLIWVQMLKLVYLTTADKELLELCRPAILKLLNRFSGYMGDKGILENAPDYMFVDWMVTDGYSMHHPPRYLGQTVLNAYYHGALVTAAEIASVCGWSEAASWRADADALRNAFNRCFYDADRGLYFDGLTDPAPESKWQPANVPARHYSRYSNILAALYDLCDEERACRLIRLCADDKTDLAPIQPYFMNFLLLAVEKYGLLAELGLPLLRKWASSVAACPKGLQEGWYKPEETYSFDHSHAWGGCPAYFLPQLFAGLTVDEPGFKAVTLRPNRAGLRNVSLRFMTPQGEVTLALSEGQKAMVTAPEGMTVKVIE